MNTSRRFVPIVIIVAILGGAGWWASRENQNVSISEQRIFNGEIKNYKECEEGCIGYWLKTAESQTTNGETRKSHYRHDSNQVYFGSTLLPSADLQTFVLLTSGYEEFIHGMDASTVYFKGLPIPGADPTTFEVLGIGIYAKDKNAVYNTDSTNDSAIILQGIDPATAQTPDLWTLVDKNGPYEGPNKVKLLE